MPKSLWAAVTPAAQSTEPLRGQRNADVVIVGGGFMGIAAALALAERGTDVVVLEAAEIGWGASGRNNGLLTAGLKRDPDEVRKLLGTERGERLLRLSGGAPLQVIKLIKALGIQCDLNTNGWIQAAHAPAALPLIARRVASWRALGAEVALIDSSDVSQRLGTGYYAGAWFDARGGSLNPLAYVRGLAAAARRAGAAIHEHSPAVGVEQRGGWRVMTPDGSVRARHLVACTNAYNQAIPKLRGTVIPLRTAQVASAPLSADQAAIILPAGESASDTQRLLTSFRVTADKRLIMGGASATAGDEGPRLFEWLYRAAHDRFQHLGRINWEFAWSGYLALTADHLPQILRVDDGFYAGVGCNGRGIAMATVTGRCIADLLLGRSDRDCEIPVLAPRRIAGFALRRPGVAISVIANRVMDVAERRLGRR